MSEPIHIPFSFGDKVVMDQETAIVGVVTGLAIYPHVFEVKVEWWAGGDLKTAWFAEWRIKLVGER